MEHGRLIDIIQKTAKRQVLDASSSSSSSSSVQQHQQQPPPLVVADMMAGVGPFAVPLAVPPPAPNANQQPAVPKVAGKRVTLPKDTPPAYAAATGRRIVVHANGSYHVLS
jgi:hypothetical protein